MQINQSHVALFRDAVDFQAAAWATLAKLDEQLDGEDFCSLFAAAKAFAIVTRSGTRLTAEEIIGTLDHIRTVREASTPKRTECSPS